MPDEKKYAFPYNENRAFGKKYRKFKLVLSTCKRTQSFYILKDLKLRI